MLQLQWFSAKVHGRSKSKDTKPWRHRAVFSTKLIELYLMHFWAPQSEYLIWKHVFYISLLIICFCDDYCLGSLHRLNLSIVGTMFEVIVVSPVADTPCCLVLPRSQKLLRSPELHHWFFFLWFQHYLVCDDQIGGKWITFQSRKSLFVNIHHLPTASFIESIECFNLLHGSDSMLKWESCPVFTWSSMSLPWNCWCCSMVGALTSSSITRCYCTTEDLSNKQLQSCVREKPYRMRLKEGGLASVVVEMYRLQAFGGLL